jgi:two-component system, cell cycle sensor histidine kinase and response regulator CckA
MTNQRRMGVVGAFAVASLALRTVGFPAAGWTLGIFLGWIAVAGAYQLVLVRVHETKVANVLHSLSFIADITWLTAVLISMSGAWWLGAPFHAFVVTFAFGSLPVRYARLVAAYSVAAWAAFVGALAAGVIPSDGLLAVSALHEHASLAAAVGVMGCMIIIATAVTQHTVIRIMRRTAERYRSLLQAARDAIVATDRRGIVTSANDAALLLMAPRTLALVGSPLSVLAHEDDRAQLDDLVEAAGRGESRELELRAPAERGEPSWYAWTGVPIHEEGVVAGALVVGRDITARRQGEEALQRKEEELRQSQKLEAIGRLAGGIAHDFNNLLTLISAYSEFLMRGIDNGTARRRDVEEIYNASLHAAALTNKLLAFSRQQVLQPRVLSLNEVIEGMDGLLRRLIDASIEIRMRLYSGVELVRADQVQVEQVLLNLAVNARDAMPDGGVLTIETDTVFLDESYTAGHPGVTPGSYVLFLMRDTGHGMSNETKTRMFEPFFTTKPAGEGTGLGLATVYGIVDQSGGHIDVDSAPGRGTTFKLYFPVVREELAEPALPSRRDDVPRGSETILLVDDGNALREVIQRVLEDFGYRVLVARNGEDALTVAEQHGEAIDILLTDVVMPQLGGRELATRLWHDRPDLRVLFMSGYTEDSVVRPALRRPGVGFIGKPFRPDILAKRVRELLDQPTRGRES